VFAVIDKIHRQPREVSAEKLRSAGLAAEHVDDILDLVSRPLNAAGEMTWVKTEDPALQQTLSDFKRYMERLEALGVSEWIDVDLSVVRGLAYYTGIVFELFDAKGELRAICGGGRYDKLLGSLGGVELPALGFGMGDVVLTELLRDRGLNAAVDTPDFWVAADESLETDVVRASAALRRAGASVEYALRKQQLNKQKKAAQSAGAAYFVTLEEGFTQTGVIRVEELGERVPGTEQSTLMRQLADRPSTLESLLTVLRDHPGIA
jgi:histidyl-tRNA synthetase